MDEQPEQHAHTSMRTDDTETRPPPEGLSAGPSRRRSRRLLRRSKQDRVIAGVCGGLARYVDIDPVLFRIAFLLMLVPGGIGLLIYIVAWIAIPEFRSEEDERLDNESTPVNRRMAGTLVGGLLIVIGALILLQQFIDWFDPRVIGGSILIIIGALIVIRGLRSE